MLIALENVSKGFAGLSVLRDVTVKVEEGDRIGVVGPNGAGKTTLLRVLTGEISPDSGQRSAKRELAAGYLRQDGGLTPTATIRQEARNVFAHLWKVQREMTAKAAEMAAMPSHDSEAYHTLAGEYDRLEAYFSANDGYNLDVQVESVLQGMGFGSFPPDTLCGTLSGGEKTRLSLAKLLLQKPGVLFLDEPTNYLDLVALDWLESYLDGLKIALVVVSHDRYFLDRCCNRIWEVEQERVEAYRGNYTKYFQARELVYQQRLEAYEAQQERIAKLEDYIVRNKTRASTSNMAKSREKELEHMRVLEKPPNPPVPAGLRFAYQEEPYKDVLQVSNLTLHAGGDPNGRALCRNLELHVGRGERVAFVGRNGIGKSTLFRTLINTKKQPGGRIRWGQGVRSGYFEQENALLHPDLSVMQEFWNRFPGFTIQQVRGTLALLQLGPEDVDKKVGSLSGGEKARLKLAILMTRQPNVLLLDEPTNHLDLMTREALDRALMEYTGTVLAITHDRYLLGKMPWRLVELTPEGFQEYPNFDAYLSARRTGNGHAFTEKKAKSEQPAPGAEIHYRGKKQRALEAARRKRRSELEQEIEALENAAQTKQAALRDPETARDYQRLEELSMELEKLHQDLDCRLEEWTQLESEGDVL